MKSVPHTLRAAPAAALVAGFVLSGSAFAGGFALVEQNAIGAGASWSNAAAASDASTVFFNPAGLALLDRPQAVAAAHLIGFDAEFQNSGSSVAGVLPISGGNGGNAGGSTFVPNLYFAQPVTKAWGWGVGLSVPWGLSTEYDAGWVGRYHALKSELKTANLSAAVGYRVNDQFSIGAGLQAQRASVTLSNAVDIGLAGYSLGLSAFFPGSADGTVNIEGEDDAYGFTAGFLWEPKLGTRVGATYRSAVKHKFHGDATFTGIHPAFAAAFPNQKARAALETPATLSIHALQDFGAKWRVTADITRWDFSSFRTLAVDFENPLTTDVAQPMNWEDASIYSVGVAYQVCDTFTLRAGAAYNESPVPDAAHRNARIPDNDRRWLSLGATWKCAENCELSAGYVHLFFSDANIANVDAFTHALVGKYELSAEIFSAQLTWRY